MSSNLKHMQRRPSVVLFLQLGVTLACLSRACTWCRPTLHSRLSSLRTKQERDTRRNASILKLLDFGALCFAKVTGADRAKGRGQWRPSWAGIDPGKNNINTALFGLDTPLHFPVMLNSKVKPLEADGFIIIRLCLLPPSPVKVR